MKSPLQRSILSASLLACLVTTAPAHAQPGPSDRGGWACSRAVGPERARCERRLAVDRDRQERRERERRKDAKKDGIVAGVIGTVIGAAVIGALVGGDKKKKEQRAREDYCLSRYGNYDPGTDSYRASDGRSYPCQ